MSLKRPLSVVLAALAVSVCGGLASPAYAAAPSQIGNVKADPRAECLDSGVQGSSKVTLYDCYQSTTWLSTNATTVGGYVYYQMKDELGRCLGVSGSSTAAGAALAVGKCTGTSDHSQLWRGSFLSGSSTKYTIVNAHSGKCAGTKNKGITANTAIVQGACTTDSSSTQIWQAVDV